MTCLFCIMYNCYLFACYMIICQSVFFLGGTKTVEYGRFLRRCPIVEWPCPRTPKTRDGRLGSALKGFSEHNSRSTSKWSRRFAHFLQSLGKIICILLGKGNLLKWLSVVFVEANAKTLSACTTEAAYMFFQCRTANQHPRGRYLGIQRWSLESSSNV